MFPLLSIHKLKYLQTDKEAKAFLYVDAVLHFARCGKAIEVHTYIHTLLLPPQWGFSGTII